MAAVSEREILYCEDASAWQNWLEAQHATCDGVRLAIAKKGGAHAGISYADAVECALCYGWIDGTAGRLNDDYYLQLFTPRRARSIWSRINRDKAIRLIEEGRMQAAGLAEVERAQADGRWDAAYASSSTIEIPQDLAAALAASPAASAFFETLSSQNRFAIMFRIGNVKRAQTRVRKIAEFVAMLERGETVYPQR